VAPTAQIGCGEMTRLARVAGPGGRLAAVVRSSVDSKQLAEASHPMRWSVPGQGYVLPWGAGRATATIQSPGGRQSFWAGGSVRSGLELRVDGRRVGAVDRELNNSGLYIPMGTAQLSAGPHRVELVYAGPGLGAGSAGPPFPLGPLVWGPGAAADTKITYVSAADARSLCGQSVDWVEALAAR
jgi:hypothetical protein